MGLVAPWHLPGLGLEPVSPALAGRFLTTAPPRKSQFIVEDTQMVDKHMKIITLLNAN